MTETKNPINYEETVDRIRVLDRAIKIVEYEYGTNQHKGSAFEPDEEGRFTLEKVEEAYRRLCNLIVE